MITMECEICGKEVDEINPIRAKIEGSVMIVCEECAKLGKIQKTPPKPKFQKTTKRKKQVNTSKNYSNNDEPKEELIENYNTTVRNARERKNWSREDLGKKINERVSVINRIESGKMVPDIKLTKKLEKTLDITLLEKVGDLDLNKYINKSSGERTLGNMVKIIRK